MVKRHGGKSSGSTPRGGKGRGVFIPARPGGNKPSMTGKLSCGFGGISRQKSGQQGGLLWA